jgi:two-component system sensor histidine kinase KdpD
MRIDKPEHFSRAARHLLALAACGLTAALALQLRELLDLANIVMLLLLTVVIVAATLGRSPAVLASFVSVALFDFFFVPPQLSFLVNDLQDVVTFAVMLAVSLFISHLMTSLQASAREARQRDRQSQALYALARALAGAMTADQVVERVASFVREQADGEARFFLPDADGALHECPRNTDVLEIENSLAIRAVFHSHPVDPSAGIGNPAGSRLLLPLAGPTGCRGVLFVRPQDAPGRLHALRPMLEAVASLAAIAVERLHFGELAHARQLETEAERLRSSILSSISHDIRTPLTMLFGLADSLSLADGQGGNEERDAARAIRDQAGRLHQMVDKLLAMARLQAGQIRLRKEWQPIDEVIGASIQLLAEALSEHPVTVSLAPNLPLVAVDAVLMERVFCNLLENAAKYSPPGAPIAVAVAADAETLTVEIRDQGEGFPPGSLPRAFGLFERGARESPVPGVGLGLAICRAIVEAHGGHIGASNPPGGGACVRFTIPCGEPPRIEPELAELSGVRS